MGENYDINSDMETDNLSDITSVSDSENSTDFGGDLAKDTAFDLNDGADDIGAAETKQTGNNDGEDLNKYSKEYGYDDYLESGEVKDPFVVNTENDSNDYNSEYTNEEIRNSLGGSKEEDLNQNLNKYSKDAGSEQLDSVLDNFQDANWSDLSLEEQKQSMTELSACVASDTGNENPPEIIFRDDMGDGEYGGYNPESNTLEINENMLDDSAEAADTIAHEMWHAHQQQCAEDSSNPRASEYQEGFDNYISPEYDFEGYQNQMVEAEARDYAQGFKDRLGG